MSTKFKLRRGTAAAWTSANPTLAAGEPGYETDTGKLKIGDGTTAWTSLAYFAAGGGGVDSIAKNGDTQLTGDVTLTGGTGISLTETGQDISIAATPLSGGSVKLYDFTITGSDQASIDTAVDGTTVANFAGYDVLEVWIYARTDETAVFSNLAINLNNDASAIYDLQQIAGVNASATAVASLAQTAWKPSVPGASAAANYFGVVKFTIPNYLGTVGYKTGDLARANNDSTAANNAMVVQAITYRSTTAISRIAVSVVTAAKKLKVGSRLLVYAR